MENNIRACKNQHDEQDCCFKIRFSTKEDAEFACFNYLTRVLFSTMSVYLCRVHDIYHLGHDRRMDNETIVERTRVQPYALVL